MLNTSGSRLIAMALFFSGIFAVQAHAEVEAKRIVSIGGSVTEIIYALGEEERLIARDTTSLFPPEALDLPDVGYIRALSPEGVLSTDPDAILALEGSGPPEAFDVLKKASVPVITIPDGFDRDSIVAKIRAVGKALDVEDKAAELAAKVEADVKAAEEQAAAGDPGKRVLFILSLAGGRIMAAGSDTGAGGIIEMAGGENAVQDISGYKQITDESVIAAAPDVILVMDRAGDHGIDAAMVSEHPALAATPAGKNGSIIKMNGLYLLGFGPRTAEAIRDLSDALQTQNN